MPTIWVSPKHHDEVVAVTLELRRENERLHKLVDAQQALLDQMSRDLELARANRNMPTYVRERLADDAINRDDDASEWPSYFNKEEMPEGGRWSETDHRWYPPPKADSNPPDVGTRPYKPYTGPRFPPDTDGA